jgi:hypothetical protein
MNVPIPNPSDVTGFELLLAMFKNMKHSELSKLRNEIDTLMEIDIPLLRFKAYEIYLRDGLLRAVKYVKDKTGWGLKECKEFMDQLKLDEKNGISFQRVN